MKYLISLILSVIIFAANAYAGKADIGGIFGGLIGSAVGGVVGKSAVSRVTVEQALVKMAEEINKQLPMTIDKNTRLDSIKSGPGRMFTYNYSIVTARAADIDKNVFFDTMSSHLKNNVCKKSDMEIFFKNGVVVSYSYHGSDGQPISTIKISPRDCGFP